MIELSFPFIYFFLQFVFDQPRNLHRTLDRYGNSYPSNGKLAINQV